MKVSRRGFFSAIGTLTAGTLVASNAGATPRRKDALLPEELCNLIVPRSGELYLEGAPTLRFSEPRIGADKWFGLRVRLGGLDNLVIAWNEVALRLNRAIADMPGRRMRFVGEYIQGETGFSTGCVIRLEKPGRLIASRFQVLPERW